MKPILLILGMALVTGFPRMLPALVLDKLRFPVWFRKWLKSIPYAALGALIVPGILTVSEEHPILGALGGAAALVLALLDVHLIFIMMGAVMVAYLIQVLIL